MDNSSCDLSSYDVASCELAGGVPKLFQGFSCISPPLYPTVLAVPWLVYIKAPLSSLGWQVESAVNTATYSSSSPLSSITVSYTKVCRQTCRQELSLIYSNYPILSLVYCCYKWQWQSEGLSVILLLYIYLLQVCTCWHNQQELTNRNKGQDGTISRWCHNGIIRAD